MLDRESSEIFSDFGSAGSLVTQKSAYCTMVYGGPTVAFFKIL